MRRDDRDAVVQKLRREYWEIKASLAALEASCAEIVGTSSISTAEGYLMLTSSGLRLLDADYVKDVVAQYHAAKERKEFLMERLIQLGEPDPDWHFLGACPWA